MATIFSKIINGELPSFKLWEDEYTYSFLTLHQISLGHSLVVPKVEVDEFLDLDDVYYRAVCDHAKLLGKAIKAATKCERVGTAFVGFEVPHVHYHIVPMNSMSDLDFRKAKERSSEENKKMQQEILAHLPS